MSDQNNSGISVSIEKVPVGVCVDCKNERRGSRCNPPISRNEQKGEVEVECMAQNGKQMSSRTDISDCTECEHYDIDLAQVPFGVVTVP